MAKFKVEVYGVAEWEEDHLEVLSYSSHVDENDLREVLSDAWKAVGDETEKGLPKTYELEAGSERHAEELALERYNEEFRKGELIIAAKFDCDISRSA